MYVRTSSVFRSCYYYLLALQENKNTQIQGKTDAARPKTRGAFEEEKTLQKMFIVHLISTVANVLKRERNQSNKERKTNNKMRMLKKDWKNKNHKYFRKK